MLEKCKESLPIVQRVIETTSDDEVMLFDALNLHEELQLAISRHSELVATMESGLAKDHNTEDHDTNEITDNTKPGSTGPSTSVHQEETADKSSKE